MAMCTTCVYLSLCISFLATSEAASEARLAPKVKFSNGLEIPSVALGTYLGFNWKGIVRNTTFRETVVNAIQDGYRHIDTASIYETESEVGAAIKEMIEKKVITREDIFITTKLWNTEHREEQVVPALQESLKQLGLTYVDLYLMHWPMGLNEDYSFSNTDYMETWRGIEETQRLGLTRSIGLSNFNKTQLQRVLDEGVIKPVALQIEVNPDIVQKDLVEYAQSKGLIILGATPLGSLVSRFGSQEEPSQLFEELSKKYGKTKPQIALRWAIDRKIVPLPKTVTPYRLKENLDIFDFNLTKSEIEQINSKDKHKRLTLPSFWQSHLYYPFEIRKSIIPDLELFNYANLELHQKEKKR